jgi:fructose-bisphosphate aldolase, class I
MNASSPSERTREILGWYGSDNPGTLTNLARLFGAGRLAGAGRLVILPIDQGFEHGPGRSFAMNVPAYDPRYHFRLAIEAGCSAFAAPLGFIEAGAREFAGRIPLILKVNSHDVLNDEKDPTQAIYASVDDALRLGCAGVGYTIYPGSARRFEMYEGLRDVVREAKARGLVVIVWSYPRGSGLTKQGETAIDVTAYAAHIAAQLGAHIVKVKLPSAYVEQPEARAVYERVGVPIATLADRVRHVVQAAFDGRRVVIFSGGAMNENDAALIDEARAIREGGGFGTIMGRNVFQRREAAAKALLAQVMDVFGS